MALHRGPAHRLLRLEGGSATVEGLVALGVSFLLLVLVVQAAFVVVARNAAEAAVAASARRAARPGADLVAERVTLAATLAATVPGASDVAVAVQRDPDAGRASAEFSWDPPGPDWLPFRMRVAVEVPVAVPP